MRPAGGRKQPRVGNVAVSWTCTACSHDRCRGYPRLANFAGLIWFVGLGGMIVGVTRGSWPWMGASLVALLISPIGHLVGGMWWWGGVRCTRCGHDTMLR